jgi:FixJ family two-component response regulator
VNPAYSTQEGDFPGAGLSFKALVGELTAALTHEVNQPLCAVVRNASTLQQKLAAETPDLTDARATLHDIVHDAGRAATVIAWVRTLVEGAPADPPAVDVPGLIREVVALVRGKMSRQQITFRLDFAAGLPQAMYDTALVHVIDADSTVRTAVGGLLKSAGFRVRMFASAEEFLHDPLIDRPACAVLDLHLPGLRGPDLPRTLKETGIVLPLVFFTGHGDVPGTVQAMKAGAVDVLARPFSDRDLLAAVRQGVAQHALAVAVEVETAGLQRRADTLTPREREVMALVVAGLPNKRVAGLLGVCEKTVKVHRGQVMRKMQAESLPDLVRMAGRLGMTAPISSGLPS